MMLVENKNVLSAVVSEFYVGNLKAEELAMFILKELKILSVIRMCNEIESWGLKLEGIKFDNIADKTTFRISNNKLFSEIDIKSPNKKISAEMYEKIFSINDIIDLLDITRGHDFSSLFTYICNETGKVNANVDKVEMCLRSAYDIKAFKNTKIFNSLCNYNNGDFSSYFVT